MPSRLLMGWLRPLGRGLRALVRRRAADRDLDDEVRDWFERAAAEHAARGLSPAEARRAARLELGTMTSAREEVRAAGWEHTVDTLVADLRYAARRLRHTPGFTAVAVVTLALGLGASTAIFGVVDPILLRPLPYPDARRLVSIADRTDAGAPLAPTFGTYAELRARSRSLAAVAAADAWRPSLTGGGTSEPERLEGRRVSASWFGTLGVRPEIGRDFDDADDVVGGPNVVILADGLARRRFGGPRMVLGRRVRLDDDEFLVVGVMPSGFSDVLAPDAELWAPMQARAHAPFDSREWGHHYRLLGRLAPGATVEAAARETAAIGHAPTSEFPRPPWADLRGGLLLRSLHDEVTASIRPVLLAVAGAVLLLLAIACVNVTNLLLARAAQRRGELAMRVALGAGRTRLLAQLLTESLLLAGIGGVLGLGVARSGVRLLVAVSPPGLSRLDAARLDARVLAFALAVTIAVGLAVGLLSAWDATRTGLRDGIRRAARGTVGGHGTARGTLVVAEVALALVLLVGAGLLLRSLERLFAVAPGFEPSHVVTMRVVESGHAFRSDSARQRFFEQALDAVRRLPGITAAAFTSQLPLSGDLDGYGYDVQSLPSADPNRGGSALRYAVTPGYFRAMGIPLRRGRYIDSSDARGAPEAIVVNESFARRLFGDRDPIGERVRFGPETRAGGRPWDVIVGVVGDVKQESLALGEPDAFYVATGQWWWVDDTQSLVVRASGDPAPLVPAIERAIWSVDRDRPIVHVATMDDLVAASESQRRFALTILEAFAVVALVLAAVGLFGVLSGGVAERRREIGVRAALGATPGSILALVMRQGLTLSALGVVLGVGGAMAASRVVATMLFGVSRLDPLTYAAVAALLLGVSAAACWVPAWRAARVDPAITLRAE